MDKVTIEELLAVIGGYEIQQRRLLAQIANLEQKNSEFQKLEERTEEHPPADGGSMEKTLGDH